MTIGIVLVTHGKLALEFKLATEHVVGRLEHFEAICIDPTDDMEKKRNDILDAVKKCDSGSGVVIFTDMFGGTPSNLSISVMQEGNIEVVAGVNLPMLIKFATVRSNNKVGEAVLIAEEAGKKYINVASKLLSKA